MALLWNCLQQVRHGAPKIHAAPLAAGTPVSPAAERRFRAPDARSGAEPGARAGVPVPARRKEAAA